MRASRHGAAASGWRRQSSGPPGGFSPKTCNSLALEGRGRVTEPVMLPVYTVVEVSPRTPMTVMPVVQEKNPKCIILRFRGLI